MENIMNNSISRQYISSEVRFYTIPELVEMLGWGELTVQKMFNDPAFPSVDFGKQKVVESHALINYFSTRRSKDTDRYWRKKGKANGKQRA